MRDNTLIVFQSDNGGTRNAMFAGERRHVEDHDPCDNGPYRDGKGSLYEGGTRVVALANWPGHIKPGGTVDGMIHVVDMYPTLAGLAGASTGKSKPLDGLDVWPTISEGKPSPRTEIVYNIEPFFAAVREGRLEARLAHDAAVPGRAFRPRAGSVGEDQPRRQEPAESGRAAAADRGIGTRGSTTSVFVGCARRDEACAFRVCRHA